MRLRRARPEDAAGLATLAEATFRAAFAADNNPTDMDAYCATAFSPAIQGGQIADPAIDTLVIEDDSGALVAYAQLRPGSPAEQTLDDPIELWRFYVTPALHGRGLAQQLMAAAFEAAGARGAATMWLGVWEKNVRARAFYRKHGFSDSGSHTFLLGSDQQTDLIMIRSL